MSSMDKIVLMRPFTFLARSQAHTHTYIHSLRHTHARTHTNITQHHYSYSYTVWGTHVRVCTWTCIGKMCPFSSDTFYVHTHKCRTHRETHLCTPTFIWHIDYHFDGNQYIDDFSVVVRSLGCSLILLLLVKYHNLKGLKLQCCNFHRIRLNWRNELDAIDFTALKISAALKAPLAKQWLF